jgi:hypothetical protein
MKGKLGNNTERRLVTVQSQEEITTPKKNFPRSSSLSQLSQSTLNRSITDDGLNQSFTERRQLKKLSSIQETKPNSNKTNQKVLNRVLQPLDNFPLHGLKFSGKDDKEEETIYKKELRQLKERETDLPSFKESLVFKLSGISYILRNPQLIPQNKPQRTEGRAPRKSVVPSKIQQPSQPLENNLVFITDLARQRYSKKVIDVLYKINDAQNKEEVNGFLKEDRNIQILLKRFNEENNEKITNSPLVFSKYALSAELLIIAKQLYVLEKTNLTIKTNKAKNTQDSHITQNADLLFSASNEAKERMIKFIERKCQFLEEQNDNLKDQNPVKGLKIKASEDAKPKSPPMQKIYENKSKAAVNSSCLQYQTLLENGKLPIYLKDPTTRSFRSKNGISLPQGVTVSEDQYNILHEIDGAISKQQGTKIYARLPTGAGKSHLEKLMNEMFLKVNDNENINEESTPLNKVSPAPAPAQKISPAQTTNNKGKSKKLRSSLSPAPLNTPQPKLTANPEEENAKTALIQNLININLNISAEELRQIGKTPDLKRNIVIADEAFFFSRLFLEGKINYETDKNINKSDIEQIEKFKDEFIRTLQNKGAIVLVMGASESLDKIGHEINRIEGKIYKEEAKIVAQSSSELIKEANKYFYSDKDSGVRKAEPIYKKIIDEQVMGGNLKEQIVTVTDKSKKGLLGSDPSKAEFVVSTAFYIKQLSQFLLPELQESDEVKNVIYNLIPKIPGGKPTQSSVNLNLTATLLGSGIFDVKKINDAPALIRNSNLRKKYIALLTRGVSIDTRELKTAVDAFFAKKLDDNTNLYDQLPKDQQQERASDGSKLGNLKEKLKVRQYQYHDLEYRRDKLTKYRFDRSEIVVETQPYNLEELSQKQDDELQKQDDELNNEIEKKSDLFAIVEKNLPKLEAGQKMQYILPDFNINDETCGEKGLRELKGHADIIIIPHFNEEEKKLKCKIACYSENDLFDLKECEIDNLDSEIKEAKKAISLTEKPSIISFFDRKNAIGGDYKTASVNISKQYIQLTKEDCFRNENDFLTWNHLMQFNRDRTDLDSVNLDNLELKFILPESSIIKDEKDDLDYDAKEIIKELLNANTEKHDKIVLEGYKMYKGITRDTSSHVNSTRGGNYNSLAIDLYDSDEDSVKKEEKSDENDLQFVEEDQKNSENNSQFVEEDQETSILLADEVDITDDYFSQSERGIEETFISDEESIVDLSKELESEEESEEESKKLDLHQQKQFSQNFYEDEENSDSESEDLDGTKKTVNTTKTGVLESPLKAKSDEDSSKISQDTKDKKNSNSYQNLGENLGGVFDQEVEERVNQEKSDKTVNAEELSDSKEQSENEQENNQNIIHDTIILYDSSGEEEENEENKSEIREVIGRIINDIESDQINIEGLSLSPIKRSRSDSYDSTHDLDGDSAIEESKLEFKEEEVTENTNSQSSDIVGPLNESFLTDNNPNSIISYRSRSSSKSTTKTVINSKEVIRSTNLEQIPIEKTPTNSSDEKEFSLLKKGEEDDYKSSQHQIPSSSPNNPELSFDFYDIREEDLQIRGFEANIAKYRQTIEAEIPELMVLKKLYEENPRDILNNIFHCIIISAVEANLNPQEALRALEIAKERKGISNGTDVNLPENFITGEDEKNFIKYSEFESNFNFSCYDCGIYSVLDEIQGLSLCNLPKLSDERFSDFVNGLKENNKNASSKESEEAEFPSETIKASKNAYEKTMAEFRKISNQRRIEVEAEEKADLGR